MDQYTIQITGPAEKDLREIGRYISRELLKPETSKKVVSTIAKAINSLEEMPLRNALVADESLAYKGIRKIMVDNYIVFFNVSGENNTVTVVRILYGRRNWISLL